MVQTTSHDLRKLLHLTQHLNALQTQLTEARKRNRLLGIGLETEPVIEDDTLPISEIIQKYDDLKEEVTALAERELEETQLVETLLQQRTEIAKLQIIIEDFQKRSQDLNTQLESEQDMDAAQDEARINLYERYLEQRQRRTDLALQLVWFRVLKKLILDKSVSNEALWKQKLRLLDIKTSSVELGQDFLQTYEIDVIERVKILVMRNDQ